MTKKCLLAWFQFGLELAEDLKKKKKKKKLYKVRKSALDFTKNTHQKTTTGNQMHQ